MKLTVVLWFLSLPPTLHRLFLSMKAMVDWRKSALSMSANSKLVP